MTDSKPVNPYLLMLALKAQEQREFPLADQSPDGEPSIPYDPDLAKQFIRNTLLAKHGLGAGE